MNARMTRGRCTWTMRRHSGRSAGWRRRMAEVLERRRANSAIPASTSHDYGDAAAALVETARAQVAAAVGAAPDEIIWTSGATEANNLAIFGVAAVLPRARPAHRHGAHRAQGGARSLPRTRAARLAGYLPGAGSATACWIPTRSPRRCGRTPCWCRIMHVNNEIGVVQDIAAIGAICAQAWRRRLHVDAAQSVGKCAVDFAEPRRGSDVAVGAQGLRTQGGGRPGGFAARRRAARPGAAHAPCNSAADRSGPCGRAPWPTHQVVGHGPGVRAGRAVLRSKPRASRGCSSGCGRDWPPIGGVLRNGNAHALGAACAQCVVRRRRRREPAGGGAPALGRVDRFGLHLGAGGALLRAARLGPRASDLSESSLRFGLGRSTR